MEMRRMKVPLLICFSRTCLVLLQLLLFPLWQKMDLESLEKPLFSLSAASLVSLPNSTGRGYWLNIYGGV